MYKEKGTTCRSIPFNVFQCLCELRNVTGQMYIHLPDFTNFFMGRDSITSEEKIDIITAKKTGAFFYILSHTEKFFDKDHRNHFTVEEISACSHRWNIFPKLNESDVRQIIEVYTTDNGTLGLLVVYKHVIAPGVVSYCLPPKPYIHTLDRLQNSL